MFPIGHSQKVHVQSCFTVPRQAFLIGSPITISKPWILKLNFGWGFRNDKQTTYFVFVTKTKHTSVSRDNSKIIVTQKEMPNYFRAIAVPLITVWGEETYRKDWYWPSKRWLLWGIFKKYTGVDKLLAGRPNFWAGTKMVTRNQSAPTNETYLEALRFALYYLSNSYNFHFHCVSIKSFRNEAFVIWLLF